eukprot:TRINITY_DN71488_c0_g1_i1.p1 TRINITY_DN71488_c0_g1~~TRINITY_DN71488_c0_g1_i1.p1  ORF type:complete len:498 (-),score=114.00 TRINITY_DN71488_c0_g1_i1:75-1568(-)
MAGDGKPKQQRTYSDPELPELLPLPVRPSSSYEPRPQIKEHSQFTKQEMEGIAHKLNLDVEENPDFRWVIRDCLLALRDEGWRVKVTGGDIEFEHADDVTRPVHAIVEAHRQLAERLMAVQQDLRKKKLNPQYRVKHHVYLAIMGEKDVRRVCTPALLRDLLEDLDVDPLYEVYLIQRIKCCVEDSYFRMLRQGGHLITVENCIDVESLLVNLELDRVGFMKKISPTGLLYCVECQTSLGDVISTGCHDVFCNAHAVETHSTGNRQDCPMVFIEQSVCAECHSKAALVRCQDCVELFCYDCFKQTHARGKRQRHCVSLPQRTFCFECDAREATYICVECEDALCTRCSARMHRSGARQNHTLFGLRKAAYSKKLFADNLDRLMGILQANVERSFSLQPWFLFYDEALAPLWYNFQTNESVRADPNNLMEPPVTKKAKGEDDEDDEVEDLEPGADDQLMEDMAGSTNLKDTHAAKFCMQSACFDVPKALSVKYSLPIK